MLSFAPLTEPMTPMTAWPNAQKLSSLCLSGFLGLLLIGVYHGLWGWLTKGTQNGIRNGFAWILFSFVFLMLGVTIEAIEARKRPKLYDTAPTASNEWNFRIGQARKNMETTLFDTFLVGVIGPFYFYKIATMVLASEVLELWMAKILIVIGLSWITIRLRVFWPAPGARCAFKSLPKDEQDRILSTLKKAKAQPTAMLLGLAARDYDQRRRRALLEEASLEEHTPPAAACSKKTYRL